jgi:hypothetical protein
MRFLVPFLLGFSVFGFLCGCSSQGKIVQKPTFQITAPTYTKTPPQTNTPTPRPTTTEWPTPTLEKKGGSILLIFISPLNLSESQVVPIPTPEKLPLHYDLRAWNESEGLAMITSMEEYAHKNDFYYLSANNNLPADYKVVDLAINEMLFRFPETKYRDDLLWRLAMSKNLQGCDPIGASHQKCSVMADWIIESVENFINQNGSETADLESFLNPRGFTVAEEYSTSNLFGDGRKEKVLRIKPQDNADPGLIFAVRKKSDNTKLQVVPIFVDVFNGGVFRKDLIAEITDRNMNGVPEVIVQETQHAGMGFYTLHIFEWNHDQFKDLSQGKIRSLYGDELMYEGVTWNGNALTILNFNKFDTYSWNGHTYELSDRENTHFVPYCHQYLIKMSIKDNLQNGINFLDSVINNWSEEQLLEVGADCPNYLRLKKGLYYAQNDRSDLARKVLQDIVDHPTNLDDSFSAEIAGVFLDSYKANEPLYFGCVKAQSKLDAKLNDESERDNWISGDSTLCDLNQAFSQMVLSFKPMFSEDPITDLKDAGVGISEFTKVDINDDGQPDWVFINSDNNSIWALIVKNQGLQPVLLDEAYHLDEEAPQSKLIVETIKVAENSTLLFVNFGNSLYTYELTELNGLNEAKDVLYEYPIEKYSVTNGDQGVEVKILYAQQKYTPEYGNLRFYHWDDKIGEFVLLPLFGDGMFTENFPDDSLPYLEEILSTFDQDIPGLDLEKAQFLYRMGLIDELTSNNEKAVQNYWQIWHDFPGSPYAVMACSKLEGCQP